MYKTRNLSIYLCAAFIFLTVSLSCSVATIHNLNRRVGKLNREGRYAEAIPLAKEAVALSEKKLGPEHHYVGASLNALALLYYYLGEYEKAEPLYKRSLAIDEKAFGPDHPKVAISLYNLATLYQVWSDYEKAEPLYKRTLAIYEKAFGPDSPKMADTLNNLALLYQTLGDYEKAESLHKRSLAIKEKALGPDHPNVAPILNNLALLYIHLGDYEKAEPLFKRSLAIKEKALGPYHPQVALSLNNLAGLYLTLRDYEKAESLLKRSLAISEKVLGPDQPLVANTLNHLALIDHSLGDYEKAEPLLKRSLAIKEKALGPEHHDVALSLNNLASNYYWLEEYEMAESLYKRSLSVAKKALGPDHPIVAHFLISQGQFYAALDDLRKAHDLQKRALKIDNKIIDQVVGFTSEDQKIKFISIKKWNLDSFLSLICQYFPDDQSAIKDALDVWLKRKGAILEAQKRFQEASVYSDHPQAVKTFYELSRVRAQLSKLVFADPSKESLEAYKNRISSLETQTEKLEGRLSKLSQAFALKQKIAKADSEKISKALPSNTVLVEFARIGMVNFKAKEKGKGSGPAHYLSFILHAGKAGTVGLVDLGNAEKIDKAVAKFKKQIANAQDASGIKAIKESKVIYNLVFEPIKAELGEVKEIFISPDGNLNLIPFEVLQGPDGRFLIEKYTFNYLAAGRDLLGFGQFKEPGEKALLLGDPDFDIGDDEKDSTLRMLASGGGKKRDSARRSFDMRRLYFDRLSGTKEEVEAIQAILGNANADLYTGKYALEEVLRQHETPSILHLATHGFFLSDLELGGLADEPISRGLSILPKSGGQKVRIENPLLRSGIALAGANRTLKSRHTEKSDGIVTAEKILGLRLRGTDMVVLSACDTGIGEVQAGEGVFGLRRAFTQAGAKSLVMSMWPVPDKETKELMVEFYRNIQSGKMSRCQALRQAALEEMKIVKKRYGHVNPIYWGAFVFMGEP